MNFTLFMLKASCFLQFTFLILLFLSPVDSYSSGYFYQEPLPDNYLPNYQLAKKSFETNRKSNFSKAEKSLKIAVEIAQKQDYQQELKHLGYQGGLFLKKKELYSRAFEMTNLCLQYASEADTFFYKCKKLTGKILVEQKKYKEAEISYAAAEYFALEKRDSILLYDLFVSKAEAYDEENQIDSTTTYHLKALKIAEQLNDSLRIARSLNEVSAIHYQLGLIDKTLDYIRRGYTYLNDTLSFQYFRFMLNEAAVLNEKGEELLAVSRYEELISKLSPEKDSILLGNAHYNSALIHEYLNHYESALFHLEEMLRYTDDTYYLFNYHVLRAMVFQKRLKCKSAQDEMYKAEGYLKYINDYFDLLGFYGTKIDIKACLKEPDSISFFVDKIMTYSDSSAYENLLGETLMIESKYSSRIQQDSIRLLSAQKEKQELSAYNQNIVLFVSILVLLASLFAVFLYRKYYIEFKKINGKLEESNTQRVKLFTNLAHELKTPLSLISGLAELVEKEDMSPAALEKIKRINQNSKKLLKSSSQLLEVAQDDFSDENTELVSVNISELTQNLLEEFRPRITYKKQSIEVLSDLPPSFIIKTNRDKLGTIITNLVDNAVKYTNIGGDIKLKLQLQSPENFAVIITNTGAGISEKDLPRLFDRYFRSESAVAEGGFGIGLSIVKEYVRQLGGKVSVKSTIDKETQFLVEIPVNNLVQESAPSAVVPSPIKSPVLEESNLFLVKEKQKERKILVVEDNYEYCLYLNSILSDEYNLVFVNNGKEALKALDADEFDLIITDWMMPEMNGIELAKAAKALNTQNNIPILMLTAGSLKGNRVRALKTGIDDYLEKSFSVEVLLTHVKNLIANKAEREFTFQNFGPESTPSNYKKEEIWLLELEDAVLESISDFDLSVDDIAVKMDLSSQQLSRKIKLLTGFTAKKYIREIRFWEARRLLETQENNSVKYVCLSIGFRDQKNFSRNFKSRFGKYPSEFLNG